MGDPADTTWVLKITKERLDEYGVPMWGKPGYRGPYYSLRQAQIQSKKQGPHPAHVQRARIAGMFVGRVRVEILELQTSYSVIGTVNLQP